MIAGVGILFGLLAVALVEATQGRLLAVPWGAAVALALVAAAILIWGVVARPRLLGKPGRPPLTPIVAARTAALALAASRTGAGVFGFYAGIALGLLPERDTPAGRDYLFAALAAALASVLVMLAGLWLESLCRLRGEGDDVDGAGRTAGPSTGRTGGEAARVSA